MFSAIKLLKPAINAPNPDRTPDFPMKGKRKEGRK
jgi:hypothetical protein